MDRVLRNATIVTGDAAGTILYDASIAIRGTTIAAIGPTAVLDAQIGDDAERIDCSNRVVLPGFANTHTHFSLTLARGMLEDFSPSHRAPFDDFAPFPLPELSAEENAVMCQLGALEAIRSGTTAVLEDGLHIERYAKEMVESGLRVVLAERAWDNAIGDVGSARGFRQDPSLAADGIDRIARLHADWHGTGDGRVSVAIAAWAPDMVSPDLFAGLRRLQERLDTLCTIHLNQFWGEVEGVRSERGMLPTEYLESQGFLNGRLIAAHCRCMSTGEEEILGRSGASVAFNSAIAARRGLSPRIADLEANGCTIAMGSDNMSEDMVEVMRTGLFMERVRRADGRSPTPEEVLRWATANGYKSLGIADAGWLAAGNKADLIVMNVERAHLVPHMRIVSTLVHQAQGRDVESVMVDGRWLMRDGVVLTIDERRVIEEADRIARRAWGRLFKDNPQLKPPSGFRCEPAI